MTENTKPKLIAAAHARAADQGIETTEREAAIWVDLVLDLVADSMNVEEPLSYPGFGTFTVKQRQAQEGRNPSTGASIKIPAATAVSFTAAPELIERIAARGPSPEPE